MRKRTAKREQFLNWMLVTCIEHAGYGFPGLIEWKYNEEQPSESFAVIYDRYEDDELLESWDGESEFKPSQTWRVDIDTMAKGLGIVRKFERAKVAHWVHDLQDSDRTNGDDGDYDVVGALLVLECALFGDQRYA